VALTGSKKTAYEAQQHPERNMSRHKL